MDISTIITIVGALNALVMALAPIVYPIVVSHLPAGRAQRVAALVADVTKAVHASLIESAGTADLSAFNTREHAIAAGVKLLRETGSRTLTKLSDEDLRSRLRGELAAIAPTILAPGDMPLPGSEAPKPAVPMDATDIEELVHVLVDQRFAELGAGWRQPEPAS